jgi:hypothetical protein
MRAIYPKAFLERGGEVSLTRPCFISYTLVYMPTVRQTAFRFTAEDLSILDAIQRRTGIVSRTEVIRMAIRALAAAQGISFGGEKRYGSGSGVKRRQKL